MKIFTSTLSKFCLISLFIVAGFLVINYETKAADTDEVLKDKIGQMIMVGFRGYSIDANSPITKDIESGRIGGVIVFDYDVALQKYDRNIKSPDQLTKLTEQLQSKAKVPLFIAVDQEGGAVNRLKEAYGFPAQISAKELGEVELPAKNYIKSQKVAQTLKSVGINVNFAPVVDVDVNPDNPAIGKLGRSFSSDPEKVYYQAWHFVRGHNRENIVSVLKHFPGHGSAWNDSHLGFTDVTDTWTKSELIPYQKLIKENMAHMIMTAHIFNANLDDKYPATLSKKVVTGMLRGDLGYKGAIISDDMQMKAITNDYKLEDVVTLSIDAGVDILLFGNNLNYEPDIAERVQNIIFDKVKKGEIKPERIDESYNRIMKLKEDMKIIIKN